MLLKQAASLRSLEELVDFVLHFYSNKFTTPKKYFEILGLLSICKKGISFEEIQEITMVDTQTLRALAIVFKIFFICFR